MAGIEIVKPGATVPIRVLMYDGATAKTGLTVNVSIERLSDGYYWTGAAWQAAYVAVGMSELSGDAHLAGVYEYNFVTESTVSAYDWRVTYSGVINRAFAGRISSNALDLLNDWATDAIAELGATPPATPTLKQAIIFQYMKLRNSFTSGGTEPNQKAKIRNDAGTIISEASESYVSGTFTKGKFGNP